MAEIQAHCNQNRIARCESEVSRRSLMAHQKEYGMRQIQAMHAANATWAASFRMFRSSKRAS